jgi:2-oxoglutarate dehydrogenase E1 component
VVRPWRKPLVVLTPKSLLRNPQCVSPLGDLAGGRFQRVIPDEGATAVRRVVLCTGKIYYELAELRRPDVAVVRVEQLYPLAEETLAAALERYPEGTPVVWVQEEPENMGAWWYMRARFGEKLLGRWPFTGVCRPASASPATGSASSHKLEQKQLLERAYAG